MALESGEWGFTIAGIAVEVWNFNLRGALQL
jgi:hypothetical protein